MKMKYNENLVQQRLITFLSAGASLVPSPVTATTSLPADMFESIIPFTWKFVFVFCILYLYLYLYLQISLSQLFLSPANQLCICLYICMLVCHMYERMKCICIWIITWIWIYLKVTSVYLSTGCDLANTLSLGQILSKRSCRTWTPNSIDHSKRNPREIQEKSKRNPPRWCEGLGPVYWTPFPPSRGNHHPRTLSRT